MPRAKAEYLEYLRSNDWQKKRVVKLSLIGWCERCGRTDCVLDVHHKTYARLGNEAFDDLMVLCRNCHEKHHFFGMSLDLTPEEKARRDRRILTAAQNQSDDGAPMELIDDGGWLDDEEPPA